MVGKTFSPGAPLLHECCIFPPRPCQRMRNRTPYIKIVRRRDGPVSAFHHRLKEKDMGKLAVIGTIEVREGTRGDVVRAVLAHRERSLKEEPGTLQFEVLVPSAEPTKIMLYELYVDGAAFAAHMKGSSMARVTEEIGSKVVSLAGIQCIPGYDFPS